MFVYVFAKEKRIARARVHGPFENRTYRKPDHFRLISNLAPFGAIVRDVIHELQHVPVVTDLGFHGWIFVVWWLCGHFGEH